MLEVNPIESLSRARNQASELTREHLREVLRMFIAARPGVYPVPFNRLSTGALNVLVFALLTYIADLRGPGSVIFAMEEPEIALPPHTQRRMVDFVSKTMGQAIVTSHSPYVIERFTPEEIVVLTRDDTGTLSSSPIALGALCAVHGDIVDQWARRISPNAATLAQYRALVNDFGLTPVARVSIAKRRLRPIASR